MQKSLDFTRFFRLFLCLYINIRLLKKKNKKIEAKGALWLHLYNIVIHLKQKQGETFCNEKYERERTAEGI